MQKKALVRFFILISAACLLAVGCAEQPDVPLGVSSDAEPSAVSEQSAFEQISLPDASSAQESTAQEISLPSPSSFELFGKLLFCPDGEWEQADECTYVSPDGTQTLRAEVLTLPDPKGITAELLVADALATLPDALAQTDAELVTLERAEITLQNQTHPAVSLVTRKEGKETYQQQVYLPDGETVLLLTVTVRGSDTRSAVWTYIQ